jgi:hypothetical protein
LALTGVELVRNKVLNPRGAGPNGAPVITRRNLATNPSLEQDEQGWTPLSAGSGTMTSGRVSVAANLRKGGSYHYRVTWTTNAAAVGGGIFYGGLGGIGIPVVAGLPYAVSLYCWTSKIQRIQLAVRWHDAAGTFISASTSTPIVTIAQYGHRIVVVGTPPAGAAYMRLRLTAVAGTGASVWVTNDWIAADGLLVEQTTQPNDYFDSTTADYGTPSADVDGTSILTEALATARVNYLRQPSAELAGDTSFAASTGTVGTIETNSSVRSFVGSRSYEVKRTTSSAGTAGRTWEAFLEAAMPGEVWSFSAYVWSATVRTINQMVTLTLNDGSVSTPILDPDPEWPAVAQVLGANAWTRVHWVFQMPNTGLPVQKLSLGFEFTDTSTASVWVDGLLVERGPFLRSFFDGSTAPDGFYTYVQAGAHRQLAPRPSHWTPDEGAEFWRAPDGIGVLGTIIRNSAAGSGTLTIVDDATAGSYTRYIEIRAEEPCTLTALGQTHAFAAAGDIYEYRDLVTLGSTGDITVDVAQEDVAPKRYTILGAGVFTGDYDGDYFDGDSLPPDPDSQYTWIGAAHDSESVLQFLPAPTLTVTPDPAHRSVNLLAEAIPTATAISIRRITPGYPTVLVRGARAAEPIGGQLPVYDHEPPLGLTSQYQAMAQYSDGTSSGWTDPVAVAIDCDDNEVWVKDVGQPLRSMRLVLRAVGGRRRPARVERHDVQGREKPVMISDVRGSAVETAVFGTKSHAEKDLFDALIGTGQVLLVQVPPTWGRRDSYYSFGDSEEVRLRQFGPIEHRDWQIDLTEVEEPGTDHTGLPDNSYQVLLAEFATYADLLAARPTYLSVLAGTAAVS